VTIPLQKTTQISFLRLFSFDYPLIFVAVSKIQITSIFFNYSVLTGKNRKLIEYYSNKFAGRSDCERFDNLIFTMYRKLISAFFSANTLGLGMLLSPVRTKKQSTS
jgi:hypothetical protein